MSGRFGVIVVGGGHAGVEAVHAASTLGVEVALVTLKADALAEAPCNPAVGGVAKGHLVKEIDALGGIIALITDRSAIHFRRLNTRKGPAVRATRAQIDKALYSRNMTEHITSLPRVTVIEAEAAEILASHGSVYGVRLADGTELFARAVVVTTGTYLRGLLHVGPEMIEGGAWGRPAARTLGASIAELGHRIGRLKTGTPPRIHRRSIDFSKLEEQPSDPSITSFSVWGPPAPLPKVSCWITWTRPATHEIIVASLDRAPLFNGQIDGIGPRYCPSIEDKVVKFPHHSRHHVFLEPEGLNSDLIYPNGLSTSLPKDVQERFIRSVPGLENAEFVRYGYAVEYDFFDPRDLHHTLESRHVSGLFLAGQINGTSGYEEAAAQGLVAGINAAHRVLEREPVTIPRRDAYIGVLIDDLVTRGVDEPYRLFTSRAENRLELREDNADVRLTPLGRRLGLVGDEQYAAFERRMEELERERSRLKSTRPSIAELERLALEASIPVPRAGVTLRELLRRPEISYSILVRAGLAERRLASSVGEHLEAEIKYEGYLAKERKLRQRMAKYASLEIPEDFDYTTVPGLRREWVEKLQKAKPRRLSEVLEIPGMTPATLTVLLAHLGRGR